MDWRRAKTILILMFLVLNIVLSVVLYRTIKTPGISEQTINNTTAILRKNNVHIERPIPRYTGNDYMLKFEETIIGEIDKKRIAAGLLGNNYDVTGDAYVNGTERLVFTDDCGFEYTDSGSNKKIFTQAKSDIDISLKNLAKKLNIPFNEFRQDDFYQLPSGEGVRSVYKGVYNNYSVYDNYIEAEVGNTGLKSLRYHYKKPVSIMSLNVKVIPVYQILITRITKHPGMTIVGVDLGFRAMNVDKDTKTLYEGLSWRIKTSDREELYFNARNGERME